MLISRNRNLLNQPVYFNSNPNAQSSNNLYKILSKYIIYI